MDNIHGYFVIADNDPSRKPLWYSSLQAAQQAKAEREKHLARWPQGWNLEYWKAKSKSFDIYEVNIGKKVNCD